MAFSKGDKLEHVIQKATELGAYQIVAFPSGRCVSRPDGKSLDKKIPRWQKIALSAAEQSSRGRIPHISTCDSLEEAIKLARGSEFSALLYENENKLSFSAAIAQHPHGKSASIMTGPEGGFDPEEVALAERAGMKICTIGPRILRCETAPLCALTAIMFARGELD